MTATDMIERAAKAVFTPYTQKNGIYTAFFKSYDAVRLAAEDDDGASHHLKELHRVARAALLAALDPEDSDAVVAVASAITECAGGGGIIVPHALAMARAAIVALKNGLAGDVAADD